MSCISLVPVSGFEPEPPVETGMHSVDLMQSIFTMCGHRKQKKDSWLPPNQSKSVLFSHPTNVSYSSVLSGVGLVTDKRIQTSVILTYDLSASYVNHGWPTVAISALHFFFTATARKPFQEFPTYLMGCLPIIRSFCFLLLNIQTLFQKSKYFFFQKKLIFDKLYIF